MTRQEKEDLLREAVDILIKLDNHLMTSRDNAEFSQWVEDLLEQPQPCTDAELASVRQELLERGDEMVSFRQLVERFDEVEDEYKDVPWNLSQIYNNFNILIGEKLCGDAISRKEVLDKAAYTVAETGWCGMTVDVKDIESLPPITLQPKTGHWISHLKLYGCEKDNYQCSECGRSIQLNKPMEELSDYPYCHCGAKME